MPEADVLRDPWCGAGALRRALITGEALRTHAASVLDRKRTTVETIVLFLVVPEVLQEALAVTNDAINVTYNTMPGHNGSDASESSTQAGIPSFSMSKQDMTASATARPFNGLPVRTGTEFIKVD